MPSLRQIRYFLSVADLGGFTPAAAALHVAQPALSRQIAQLEEELGFALLRREPRGVSLTEAGALFRQRVGGLEEELRSAAEDARRLHRVCIAGTPHLEPYLLDGAFVQKIIRPADDRTRRDFILKYLSFPFNKLVLHASLVPHPYCRHIEKQ